MNQRYANIENAHKSITGSHKSTFDWIFSRNGPGFVEWLESEQSLFWINGKAGSGKSTLMKFIAEDPRLVKHLNMQDPSLDLVCAKCFFWSAGSRQQKSQEGLFKSILHTILTKHHHMLRVLFPEHWPALYELATDMRTEELALKLEEQRRKAGRTGSSARIEAEVDRRVLGKLSATAELRWTTADLLRAVTQLFSTSLESRTFLLIDGLDEFEGEGELSDLVALITSWSQHPNIKVCVSTRPWTIFEANFGNGITPSLRIQDLTSDDIALFVQDSFGSSPLMKVLQEANPSRAPDFHQSIVSKAEGVFLWVRLVVKSLIDGLRNGDELSVLQERVAELPADLETLYRHMLQRIPERYQETSARLFGIMGATSKAPSSLLLWYVGERTHEPVEEELGDRTKVARCYQVHLRLMSQCAGLLELRTNTGMKSDIVDEDNPDLTRLDEGWSFSIRQHYIHSTVHYLHRTTRDFLHQPDIKKLMEERQAKSTFDCYSWLAIYAFISVYELRRRIARIQEMGVYDEWEMFGFERSEKSNYFKKCLRRARNEDVREILIDLSERLDDLVSQEDGALRSVSEDLKLALGYIDCRDLAVDLATLKS